MANWQRIATLHELGEGGLQGRTVAGKDIALARVNGAVYAFNSICTHAEVCLADGWLEGFEVECPAHGARFDVRSGAVACPPAAEALATYPVKIEGEEIYVDLGS